MIIISRKNFYVAILKYENFDEAFQYSVNKSQTNFGALSKIK